MAGELRLGRNTQATARMIVAAAVVGGALTAAWGSAADDLFGWNAFERDHGPWGAWGMTGAFGAAILTYLVLWLRQPRGARVTWDDWGVTEWDGEGVRAAIAKEKLAKQLLLTTAAQVRGPNPLANAVAGAVLAQSDLPGGSIGGHLVLSDEDGRRIDVTQGVQNVTLNRRLSTVEVLGALTESEPVRSAPQGKAPSLPSSENLAVLGYLLGIAGYVAAFFSLLVVGFNRNQPMLWVLPLGAAVLLLLRSLPWWVRARRLGRPDRGAVKVTIEGGSGDLLQLRDAAGAPLNVDLAVLKHPDAALATRTGDAWVVRGKDGKVVGVETAGARQARRAFAFATRLEAALRTLLALLVLLPAAPIVFGALRELQGGVQGVTVAYSSSGQVLSLDTQSHLALTISYDGPRLVDFATGQEIATLPGEDCFRGQGVLAPGGGSLLLSCDEQSGPFVLFTRDPELRRAGVIETELFEPRFGFDGPQTLIAGDHIARISAWELPSLRKLREMPWSSSYSLRGLVVSPATHEVFFSGWDSDRPAKAYRWSGEGPPAAIEATHDTLGAIALSNDGKLLALAVKDGVDLVDLAAGTRLSTLKLDVRSTEALAFSADGRTLAVATEGRSYTDPNLIHFADVPSLQTVGTRALRWRRSTFDFVNETPKALAWAADGGLYAIGGGKIFRVEPPPRR